jgi:hypothetical protein
LLSKLAYKRNFTSTILQALLSQPQMPALVKLAIDKRPNQAAKY